MELAVGASEATIKSLLTKLGSLLAEQYALARGVRSDIQFINDELASMQAFLSNLGNSTDDHDDQTKDWMKQVRDVSYDIEDCVDDFTNGLRPDPQRDDWRSKARGFLYEIWTLSRRRSIAAQIADLKQRAQHVGERRGRYGVRDPNPGSGKSGLDGYTTAEHQEITRRLIGIQRPVGVDIAELEKWIKSPEKKRSVISIYGFGGVGKTTAAMALYRSCGVHFTCRAMVTVSHHTDPDVVLREILRQVKMQVKDQQVQNSTVNTSEKKNPAAAAPPRMLSRLSQFRLYCRNQDKDGKASGKERQLIIDDLLKHLRKNRYLLLIDDVWSSSMWQTILNCLPENDENSRIIVTTRFEAVAKTSHLDHDHFHQMDPLSVKYAEHLFNTSLSECRDAQSSKTSQSDQVPPRVWKMCGGLPLPIVTMAGLMASNKLMKREEWNKVCEALFPDEQVCHKPEEFMRIINYCYSALPSDLKTCSLYFSIFPKGRSISKKRLIRRWIAEGFVSEKQGLSVDDVAETCFNQLIKRQIIRPVQNSTDGKVKSCQVHDMVLEYIITKAAEENFVTVVGGQWSIPTRSSKVRRMSLHSSDSKHARKAYGMNLSHVRSLTLFGSLEQQRFKSFKTGIVQVLDLEGCSGFKAKHASVSDICKMTLLKYLSLRGTDISVLPPNIGGLKYLETLDIRQTEVEELPKTVVLLERISNILGGDKRTRKALKLPKEMKKGAMKTLRVLSGIEITEESTAVSNLHELTGLKKLAIYKLHKSDHDDLLSSIQYLGGYSLKTLVIDDESSEFHDKLGKMSTPPVYLNALELSGKLCNFPSWITKLRDIVKLTLSATLLGPENLECLRDLKTLFSLTFSVHATKHDPDIAAILHKNKSDYGGEIFFPPGGFANLKLFRIFTPILPSLNFSEGSMPGLERLALCFKLLEGLHGVEKLKSLHDVILTVDGEAGSTTQSIINDLKEAKEAAKSNYVLDIKENSVMN
ncbi:disease resistance protein Pik-2-like [Triticum dicoccoides]|uniref:disease resistance protein Pik-2-like n=1 Tax=Triticum dicoccoides TaxID=85692 RepID=UPI001891F0E2|nr:disease resistance protein Pik-2-like [Triticum dicoccoides]